jgi:hypothetical protein
MAEISDTTRSSRILPARRSLDAGAGSAPSPAKARAHRALALKGKAEEIPPAEEGEVLMEGLVYLIVHGKDCDKGTKCRECRRLRVLRRLLLARFA